MEYITAFQLPCQDQSESFLFNSLPGEVRDKIFTFVLNCYENPEKLWNKDTPYVRPGHSAAQVADTALLQTCQRIYAENWFRSWVSLTHTFYLTAPDRRPTENETTTVQKLQPRLDQLFHAHGEVEISHVQVFAQMYKLETANSLVIPILNMNNFFPHKLTVTIRHHDWWCWENDELLRIDAHWIRVCRFPDSLREVCMELESLQRKKNQVDWVANEMVKAWHLERKDGTIMSADNDELDVSNWSGSSTWNNERWVRDETKPSINEYYVKTVTWKPNTEKADRPQPPHLRVPNSFPVMSSSRPSIRVSLLKQADIPAGLPADETMRRIQEWQDRRSNENVHDGAGDDLDVDGDNDSGSDPPSPYHFEDEHASDADEEAVEAYFQDALENDSDTESADD